MSSEHPSFPILKAIEQDPETVDDLLKSGADLNEVDERGQTPLMEAAFYGMSDSVALLIGKNVPIDAVNLEGKTALHEAFKPHESGEAACIKCVRLLIRAGADINAQDHEGNTPLLMAMALPSDNSGNIRTLLDAGADPLIANHSGQVAYDFLKEDSDRFKNGTRERIAIIHEHAQMQRLTPQLNRSRASARL